VNMLYALYESLRCSWRKDGEGLHPAPGGTRGPRGGLETMGLTMRWTSPSACHAQHRRCPEGIDELAVRKRLRQEFKIEIGGGIGPLAGKDLADRSHGPYGRRGDVDRFFCRPCGRSSPEGISALAAERRSPGSVSPQEGLKRVRGRRRRTPRTA
jgi:hypothetical protein